MIIELTHVTVLRNGITALNDITCTFDSTLSQSYALLGANGAGKSTLFAAILGLLPLKQGTISVDNITLTPKNLRDIRRRIGMIFQEADNQLFSQTVAEDVRFGPANQGLTDDCINARVADAMKQCNIEHLATRDTALLSGGEKRRVALAGVIAMQPDAILLDEPTSMLDPGGCRKLGAFLDSMRALRVIATHDIPFAAAHTEQCIILKDNAIRATGATQQLLADHKLLLECSLA